MGLDEKLSAEEEQKRSVLSQLLERTLELHPEWNFLNDRAILVGYDKAGSSKPLLFGFDEYPVIIVRYNELRDLFGSDVLVYFSGDPFPNFCSMNNLYPFVLEHAVNTGRVSPNRLVKKVLKCSNRIFGV